MALTTQDLNQIKTSISEVVRPGFDEINQRFDDANKRFSALRHDLDILNVATNRKFHTAFTDITITREDLNVVKQIVSEHGYRLARLERQEGER